MPDIPNSKIKEKNYMEEIIMLLVEHIYEILMGIAMVIVTLANKPKSAEKLRKIKEKNLAKLKARRAKEVEKIAKETAEIDKLEKEVGQNASST